MRSVNVPPISMATTSTLNLPAVPYIACRVRSSGQATGFRTFWTCAFWLQVDPSVKADMASRRSAPAGAGFAARNAKFMPDPSRRPAISVFTDRAWHENQHRVAPQRVASVRLAADIGGTFTDIAVFDDRSGKLVFGKALSTPARLVDGISHGVAKAGSDYRSAGLFLHGSTVAINTVLERTGARTALIITRGISRHLRDRPHQPAGRLQPVLPEARAAGRAGAALRGQGAGSGRRRDRPAAR